MGILMAVGALETSGQLGLMSAFLDKHVHEPYLISFVIGVLSSVWTTWLWLRQQCGMYPIVPDAANLTPLCSVLCIGRRFLDIPCLLCRDWR
ncbi:MAG: hypothetical protein ACLR6J_07635 [Parabacteroides merdae]